MLFNMRNMFVLALSFLLLLLLYHVYANKYFILLLYSFYTIAYLIWPKSAIIIIIIVIIFTSGRILNFRPGSWPKSKLFAQLTHIRQFSYTLHCDKGCSLSPLNGLLSLFANPKNIFYISSKNKLVLLRLLWYFRNNKREIALSRTYNVCLALIIFIIIILFFSYFLPLLLGIRYSDE